MKIKFLSYGSNEELLSTDLDHIPAIGDFMMLTETIRPNWKDHFYIVRAVTHLLDNSVQIHLEKYNPDEQKDILSKLKEKFNEKYGSEA